MITRAKWNVIVENCDVTCSVCSELLPRAYAYLQCEHTLCGVCLEHMFELSGDRSQVRCPQCRKVSHDVTQRSPDIDAILESYPREMTCGLVCKGWERAENHDANCFVCMEMKNQELEKTVEMLELENRRLHSTLTHTRTRADIMQAQIDIFENFLN
jgi:hypothetical protein